MNLAALSFSNVYDAFKNNDYQTGSLTISGTIPAGNIASYSGTVTLDRADSVAQVYFTSTVNSLFTSTNQIYLYSAETTIEHDNGSTPTFPGFAPYTILFSLGYSSTTLTFTANILNPYSETLTPVTETISFEVYTFVAPFND